MRLLATHAIRLAVLIPFFFFNACSEETPAPPQITSLEPSAGSIGTQIKIKGSGFGKSDRMVKFNGVSATILSGIDSELTVIVPTSTTGEVTFENKIGSATGPTFTYQSAGKEINSVTLGNYSVTISNKDIAIKVPALTNVTQLAPVFTISEHATISPASGTPQNFTNPVQYTVTAEDNSTSVYTVSVSLTYGISKLIVMSGNLNAGTATIDYTTFIARADVSFATLRSREYSNIPVSFNATVEPGFLITPPNESTIDLNNPGVIYAKASNDVVQTYTLQIRNKDASFSGFALHGANYAFQSHQAFPEEAQGLANIDLVMRILTNENYVNVVPAAIHIPERATLTPSAQTAVDFTNDVTYKVTSETGVQNQVKVRVLRYDMLIPNDYKNSLDNIAANGNPFWITYRSVSDVTAAKLIHATTGAEITCTVSKLVSNGTNYLYVYPPGAITAGDYKLQVQLANGNTVTFRSLFRAS